MQISPKEVAAPHLEYLRQLGILHRACDRDNWPLDQHPLDVYQGGALGLTHGENPRHCDGDGDWYWSSRTPWQKTGDVPHDCKHIRGKWGVDKDNVYRYITGEED